MIPEAVPLEQVLMRVGLALLAGLTVGYERETHGRAAGLRTTMLVCVAAAIAMVISTNLLTDNTPDAGFRPDPARLAQGILTGIGFLGAGSIMRTGNHIRGLTTAAVLWNVTILGLAFGSGYFLLGIIGWGVVLLALYILPGVEKYIQTDREALLIVTATLQNPDLAAITGHLREVDVEVRRVQLEHDLRLEERKIRFDLSFQEPHALDLPQEIIGRLTALPGVLRVQWTYGYKE